MQSLPITRLTGRLARNIATPILVTAFAVFMFALPKSARAQVQVFFSAAPPDGTIEPINQPYYLTVQRTDQYGVNALGVEDVTIGGHVFGWPEPGCGPGGIHTFKAVNQAAPPPPWYGYQWLVEVQGCDRPSVWFTTYSSAGLYPIQ